MKKMKELRAVILLQIAMCSQEEEQLFFILHQKKFLPYKGSFDKSSFWFLKINFSSAQKFASSLFSFSSLQKWERRKRRRSELSLFPFVIQLCGDSCFDMASNLVCRVSEKLEALRRGRCGQKTMVGRPPCDDWELWRRRRRKGGGGGRRWSDKKTARNKASKLCTEKEKGGHRGAPGKGLQPVSAMEGQQHDVVTPTGECRSRHNPVGLVPAGRPHLTHSPLQHPVFSARLWFLCVCLHLAIPPAAACDR